MRFLGLRATVCMICLLLSMPGATSAQGPLRVHPGKEYLVYQPETGPFDANVVAGTYHFEWFDPSSHKTVETSRRHVTGGSIRFTPPFDGTAVLYLKGD